jgi:type I restriction enzyme S subunit
MKPVNWERKPLGAVADLCLGKMLDQNKNRGEPLPYLANVNVRWGEFELSDLRTMRFEPKEMDRYGLKFGDIVMCEGGEPGRCAIWKDQIPGMMIQKAIHRIRPKEFLDYRFLFYSFLHLSNSKVFDQYFTGATIKHLPGEKLAKIDVDIPPLPVQQRIAGILSVYDELIENSQRRIKILEAMARALYREWFVYFRFPGHESIPRVPSPLGDIPQGWEVKKLGEIAENFDRLRRPLSKMQRAEMQGEYPYYGAAKVFDYVNDFIFDGEYLLMAEDGSVITTERAPVLQLVNERFWPNNHTHVLRAKPPISTHFLYLGLSQVDVSPYITGAAQPKITQENMNRIPFFCGPTKLHKEFNGLVAPMIRQSQIVQRKIQNLRRTRDLLLPRLLSGQISLVEN